MDQVKDSLLSAIIYLSRFLFIAFLVFGIYMADKAPFVVKILAIIVFIIGPLAFVYGMQMMKKSKTINDYEPTQLLGRKCNGKQARSFSQGLGIMGILFTITGIVLYFASA